MIAIEILQIVALSALMGIGISMLIDYYSK
jgi:hypothetical protein